MEEALEFEVGGGGGFGAVARRFCGESVFGAGAQTNDVPGEMGIADSSCDAAGEAFGEREHVGEGSGR